LITVGVPSRGVVKTLVDEAITTITLICPDPVLCGRVVRRHRAKIGSCWRKRTRAGLSIPGRERF
jgi:hypothetical protein